MKASLFLKIISLSILTFFPLSSNIYAEENQKEMIETETSSPVTSVTMALGISGEEFTPVNQTDIFKPADIIHAVVRVENAPADTTLSASWIAVDVGNAAEPNTLITSTDIKVEGTRNVDFTLTPSKTFPEGKYQVDISVNGVFDSSKSFMIKK